jgi:hypothetical protein
MHLEHILSSFADLCDAPLAWVMVALLAAKTLQSLLVYAHCPLISGSSAEIGAAAADALVQRPVLHSPRFLILMLLGLALAIGGLYGLASPDYGAMALAALVIGVFLLIVEPSQLGIDENQLRVIAAGEDSERRALAVDRLRYAHWERMALEVALTVIVFLVILLY